VHIERDGPHTPCNHAKKPKIVARKVSLISVNLRTSSVYCKSTYNLSHSKFMCFIALAIAFCSFQQNRAKGLLKTCTFMTR
jgi:hypothetical protein